MRYLMVAFAAALGWSLTALNHLSAEENKGPRSRQKANSTGFAAEANDLVVGKPLRHQNLTVFPVLSRMPKSEDLYITLDEGLRSGKVEVTEVGAPRQGMQQANRSATERSRSIQRSNLAEDPFDSPRSPRSRLSRKQTSPAVEDPFGEPQAAQRPRQQVEVVGDVNRVMVLNRSDKPLYLMPGEMIFGGKQDRCIGGEMLIVPGEKPVPVKVYCVEHGRWSGRNEAEGAAMLELFSNASSLPADQKALRELSAEANQGKFVASAGSVDKSTRRAVQEGHGQQEVWNQVGAANARSGVRAQTGAFTANYASRNLVKQLGAYLEELERPVSESRQIVGVVVAINGKVESMDVFQSTPLFLKLWPKLLKSYALDAATSADAANANKLCKWKDADSFLQDAMEAQVSSKTEGERVAVTRRQSRRVVSFSAELAAPANARFRARSAKGSASAMGGMGMGGMGSDVHSSAFSRE